MVRKLVVTASACLIAGVIVAACGDTIVINQIAPEAGAPPGPPGTPPTSDDGGADACADDCGTVVPACPGGTETTLTGTVYAPNGKLPLPDVNVYVPTGDLDALPAGALCCVPISGAPVVKTVSGALGEFTLHNPPVGTSIPLVVQIGKWRRKVVLPEIKACQENKLTDPEQTRLPAKQSEGAMPRIALTTGGCDNIGCILPKIGIDASELGVATDGATKAVNLFKASGGGGPATATDAATLWSDVATLSPYDIVILSCECQEALTNKGGATTGAPFTAMTTYLAGGGRILTTDFGYTWLRYSSNAALAAAANIRGGAPIGGSPLTVEPTHPKAALLTDWLNNVTKSSTVAPDVVFSNIVSVDPTAGQVWMKSPDPQAGPRVFTVDVPVGGTKCGRATHIDVHSNNTDSIDTTYPAGCGTPMKAGEDLAAFLFYELATCP